MFVQIIIIIKKIGRDGGERRGLWKCKMRKIFCLGKHHVCRKYNTRYCEKLSTDISGLSHSLL